MARWYRISDSNRAPLGSLRPSVATRSGGQSRRAKVSPGERDRLPNRLPQVRLVGRRPARPRPVRHFVGEDEPAAAYPCMTVREWLLWQAGALGDSRIGVRPLVRPCSVCPPEFAAEARRKSLCVRATIGSCGQLP